MFSHLVGTGTFGTMGTLPERKVLILSPDAETILHDLDAEKATTL